MTTTPQPQTPQRFGLPEAAIEAIQQVLAAHPEIDLTLVGPAVGFSTQARIEAELDDLLLPWMIDLSRLDDLSHPPLLAHIERVGQVLYRRADGQE